LNFHLHIFIVQYNIRIMMVLYMFLVRDLF